MRSDVGPSPAGSPIYRCLEPAHLTAFPSTIKSLRLKTKSIDYPWSYADGGSIARSCGVRNPTIPNTCGDKFMRFCGARTRRGGNQAHGLPAQLNSALHIGGSIMNIWGARTRGGWPCKRVAGWGITKDRVAAPIMAENLQAQKISVAIKTPEEHIAGMQKGMNDD